MTVDDKVSRGEFEEFAGLTVEQLQAIFCDVEKEPLFKRMRVLWQLRSMATPEAIAALDAGLKVERGALVRHEIAYALGQIGDPRVIPVLQRLLEDEEENSMVRHEAAEAMGALCNPDCLECLRRYENHPTPEIRETCQISIAKIENEQGRRLEHLEDKNCEFVSVDPALPFKEKKSVQELREILLNTECSLYDRYKAMFALRNIGGLEAIQALCDALVDKSALFKHEICFVLGQLQHPAAAPALMKVLEDMSEHAMVRHEAAEALGAVAAEGTYEFLERFVNDSEPAVKDSVVVALDMHKYWSAFNNRGKDDAAAAAAATSAN